MDVSASNLFSKLLDRVVILEMQGFHASTMIVKELFITDAKMTEGHHYFFEPPYPSEILTTDQRRAVRYCTRSVHGLEWERGHVPYSEMSRIISEDTANYEVIVTKGEEKRKFFESILGRNVVNLDCVIYDKLENMHQHRTASVQCDHCGKCAVDNARKIASWFQKFQTALQY